MDLVNELQVSVDKDDVITVLRKAIRLASKLKVSDIDSWLKNEMNGYDGATEVPSYRKVQGTITVQTNGFVPMGYNQIGNGTLPVSALPTVDMPVRLSMPHLLQFMQAEEDLAYEIEDERILSTIKQFIHPQYQRQFSYYVKCLRQAVHAIPDNVKNVILEWALALESKGVLGEGLSFNASEIKTAQSIVFNIHNSRIEQLNNMGENKKS